MAWTKLYIKPNKLAQKAAKRGLEARAKAPKSKKGGLDAMQAYEMGVGSGVLRARDIVAGKRVNAYQVNAFFNRHLKNYVNASIEGLKPVESKAIQAWLLWGGEPLRKQAAAAVRKDKAKGNPMPRRDDEYSSEWLFEQLMNGNKEVLWVSNHGDARSADWREEAESKGFKTIVVELREKDFDRDRWSEFFESMGDSPDGTVPEEWIVYADTESGRKKADRMQRILSGDMRLTEEGHFREFGDILGYNKEQTNEMAVERFSPREDIIKTIDEYCARSEGPQYDKAKRNPAGNTSRDPARMSDEDLQAELDSAVGRVGEAVHQTEWEQEPEYVLGYEPSGRVIYKSSPGERFPKTLEGPPHDYTPEQYRERLRRDYDIFQEILRRPHLSVIDIESERFLRGKSGGDEDLRRYVNNWRDEQVGLAWYERDRGNKELQARQEASAIMEGRSSKQIRYNEYLKKQFAQLPHVRYDAFDDSSRSNPIARSVAKRNRRAKRNPIETRSLTDDEIEDQMAAIGCLIEKSARNSDDYPHEAERSLPQTRRVWGLYKSLEKEKDGRRARRNPMPPMEEYDAWTMFLFMKAGEKDVLTLDDPRDLMHLKIINEAELLGYDITDLDDKESGSEMVVVNLPTPGARLKASRFMEIWEEDLKMPKGYEETDEDWIEMGFLLDYDKNQTLQKIGRLGKGESKRLRQKIHDIQNEMCMRKFDEEGDPFDANKKFSVNDLLSANKLQDDAHARMEKALDDDCDAAIKYNVIKNKLSSEDRDKAFKIVGAERNPDHIVDLTKRRREAEAERILGSFSPEDLDPLEESASAIMDSVDDYCRVRGNPLKRKRMGGEYINPKKRKKNQDETRAQEARRLLGLRAPAMTGGGLHTDKKKEASRKGARKKIKASDYE